MVDNNAQTVVDKVDFIALQAEFQETALFLTAEAVNLRIIIVKGLNEDFLDIAAMQLVVLQHLQDIGIGRMFLQIGNNLQYIAQIRNLLKLLRL